MVSAFKSAYDKMGERLQHGCTPLTWDTYGIANSYSCPSGYLEETDNLRK